MHRRFFGFAVFSSFVGFGLAPLACSSGSSGVPSIVTQPPVNNQDAAGRPDTSATDAAGTDAAATSDTAPPVDAAPVDVECTNSRKDTNETDVDCGGPKCRKCVDGKQCVAATDCAGGFCELNTKQCSTPSCSDAIRNGNETDVDCGGGTCRVCAVGRRCTLAADCATAACNIVDGACACPTRMVTVSKATGGAYCIDDTEVTNGDYDRFIRANVPAVGTGSTQPAACVANTTFIPAGAWPPAQPLSTSFGIPVRHVDWCDAFAYCKWAGKVLCGDVAGQPVAVAEANNASTNAWYNACSAQGANAFPYARLPSDHDNSRCYENRQAPGPVSDWADSGGFIAIPVPGDRMRLCQGGVVGLFQMSGNVAEWENSCDGTGATAACRVRGGSYLAPATTASVQCDATRSESRLDTRPDVGIRCCQF